MHAAASAAAVLRSPVGSGRRDADISGRTENSVFQLPPTLLSCLAATCDFLLHFFKVCLHDIITGRLTATSDFFRLSADVLLACAKCRRSCFFSRKVRRRFLNDASEQQKRTCHPLNQPLDRVFFKRQQSPRVESHENKTRT